MTRTAGYTIIELLVVMAVLGLLSAAAVPMAELVAKRNKERELKQALWGIRQAIDAYKQTTGEGKLSGVATASGYPPSLDVLSSGFVDQRTGKTVYLLRRLPKDPFAPVGSPAQQSWGLRSYASTAEQPRPGVDVFDVHSNAEGIGLNGVPYKEW